MYTKDEEVALMQKPDKWPHMVLLPLTRSNGESPAFNTGFLYQPSMRTPCPAPQTAVYLANIFDKDATVNAVKADRKLEYASFEAIYDDGWRVD